jgi:hypothetical protein
MAGLPSLDAVVEALASPLGAIAFVPLYALWVTLLLPGVWASMLAGALYGTAWGSVVVFVGACLGAELVFLGEALQVKPEDHTATGRLLSCAGMGRLPPPWPPHLLLPTWLCCICHHFHRCNASCFLPCCCQASFILNLWLFALLIFVSFLCSLDPWLGLL